MSSVPGAVQWAKGSIVDTDADIESFFFAFLWPHGCPQARGRIGAVATGHSHSHSNTRSKPRLRPTPQPVAMLDP